MRPAYRRLSLPALGLALPPGVDNGVNLFDLAVDPLETRSVADLRPEAVRALEESLDGYLRRAQQAIESSERLADEQIEPDALERLRALGYVE